MEDTKILRLFGNKKVSKVSGVNKVSEKFSKNHPSPQRGEGEFVGGAVQMRVRGSILPLKNFSPFTFHFSQQTFRHAERRIDLRDSASQDKILKQVQNDVKDGKSVKKAAFTLAEVLITLGIIGLVAAITMPLLIKNIQKHILKTQFKKTYSTLYNAFEKTKSDLEYTPDCTYTNMGAATSKRNDCISYHTAVLNNLKIIKTCNGYAKRDGCIKDIKGTDIIKQQEYLTSFKQESIDTSNYAVVLNNGSIFMFYNGNGKLGWPIYLVDVNGTKSPNKWGYDVFPLISFNNKLTCYYATKEEGGTTCAEMIKNF